MFLFLFNIRPSDLEVYLRSGMSMTYYTIIQAIFEVILSHPSSIFRRRESNQGPLGRKSYVVTISPCCRLDSFCIVL